MSAGAIKYDRVISHDDGSSVSKLVKWIRPGSKILECGPATGAMTKILTNDLKCNVTCIEIDSEAAELARQYCSKMFIANLETINPEEILKEEKFEYIIFADVLEHLISPDKVLEKFKPHLEDNGEILVSIPNISHAVILGELIQGKFDYQNDGLLDNTHLHFFTRKSLKDLCKKCNLGILEWDRTIRSPHSTEFGVSFQQLPESVKTLFSSYPDSNTYQFLARLTKTTTTQVLHTEDQETKAANPLPGYINSVLYYSPSALFNEDKSEQKIISISEADYEITFNLPPETKFIRFDPVDSKIAFALINIEVRDSSKKSIWHWDAGQDSGNNYYVQNITFTPAIHAVLNFPLNNDPQIFLTLPAPLKQHCTLTAKISFNIPHYFNEYSVEIKKLLDSRQKALDEHYLANQNLRKANLELHEEIKNLTRKYESTLSEIKFNQEVLTNSIKAENNILTVRLNEMHSMLSGIWNSKSWKITKPLRGAALIFRSFKGIIRKIKFNAWDNVKKLSYKSYKIFKYLYKNNYLSESEAYQIWTEHQPKPDLSRNFKYQPKISIILPVYKTPVKWLIECIKSVTNQSYTNWELCISDDCSDDPGIRSVLSTFVSADPRIKVVHRTKNGHIAECSQSALDLASGEFFSLLDHDDLLHQDAIYWVVDKLNENPELDFIYSNEDKISLDGKLHLPAFKPGWSPEYFLSFMYTGHLATYRTEVARKAGGFHKGTEGSQDYDLTLRVASVTDKIAHIPKILYHWREHQDSIALNLNCKDYAFTAAKNSLTKYANRISKTSMEIYGSPYKGIYRMKAIQNEIFASFTYNKHLSVPEFREFLAQCLKDSSSEVVIIRRNDCRFAPELLGLICSPLYLDKVAAVSPVLTYDNKVVACGYTIQNGKIIPLLEGAPLKDAGFGARLAAMHNTAILTLDFMAIKRESLQAALKTIQTACTFTDIAVEISSTIMKSGKRIVIVPEQISLPETKALIGIERLKSEYRDLSDPYLPENINFANKPYSFI